MLIYLINIHFYEKYKIVLKMFILIQIMAMLFSPFAQEGEKSFFQIPSVSGSRNNNFNETLQKLSQFLFHRGMVIGLLSPILRQTGYGLSWQEGIVMTWGGLRGAVGLMLALQVAHHNRIDQESVGVRVSVRLFDT